MKIEGKREREKKKEKKKEGEEENGRATFYDLSSQFRWCGNYEQAFINISGWNLVSLYAGRTRLRAFFRGKKSTFEIYGRFERIYADSSESLPLGQIFPYRDELWIRDESMLSFGFFSRSRERNFVEFPDFYL